MLGTNFSNPPKESLLCLDITEKPQNIRIMITESEQDCIINRVAMTSAEYEQQMILMTHDIIHYAGHTRMYIRIEYNSGN